MKTILLGMAATSALIVAAPAAAQYQSGGYQNQAALNTSIEGRIMQLDARIETGVRTGLISRREAPALRMQLRQLRQLELQYRVNGINARERAELQQRLRNLRQQVRAADRGARGRYDMDDRNWDNGQNGNAVTGDWIDRNNDGFDDRDLDRDGRWDDDANNGRAVTGDWIDRNRDGYDDRDLDRDGRWDDDANNGTYQPQQPAPRTGIGGLIDSVLGTGGLRVGQRASANLYGLPSGYQNQYRDGNGVYYRTDGRQIYQIDARTQTVVRVYAMNR